MSKKNINPKSLNQDQFTFHTLTNNLLTQVIGSPPDEVDEIIRSSLQEACNYFEAEDGLILLYDRETVSWQIAYHWQTQNIPPRQNQTHSLAFGTYPWTEKKILANQEVLINNLADLSAEAQQDYAVFASSGMKSIISEPLLGKGKSIRGCIVLGTFTHAHIWNEQTSKELRYFSTIIANVLSWFISEQERKKRESYISLSNRFTQIALESKSYKIASDKIVSYLNELIPTDLCGFAIWDEEQKTILPIAAYGKFSQDFLDLKIRKNEKTLTDIVLRQQQPLIIEDVKDPQYTDFQIIQKIPLTSLMILPLRSESNDFGSIFLGYTQPHPFTQDEILFSKLAAAQISLSLNKMMLFEKNQHQINELNIITQISSFLRNAQSLAEIPEIVINKVLEVIGIQQAAILFSDPVNNLPSAFYVGGGWASIKQNDFLAKYDLYTQVVASNAIYQCRQHNSASTSATPEEDEYLLGFPIIAHKQSMGVFCAGARNSFTNEKIGILSAVVDLLANAVYRQSLVDNLQIQVETLRKTRMQLVQSEKLAAIGELVAGVAHELNNPLTTISLWAELLQQQSISDQDRYDLSKIISEARRAANIVHSLLDFSRQHPPERKPVDINVLIQGTVDMVNFELKKNNVSCQLNLAANIPLTIADPYQIKQVFLNLINNANQAMRSVREEGVLKISTEVGSTQYYNQIDHQTNVIRVIFEDNGVGIPPALLPKIFDPFFTTKSEGTGLGLSVCHGIITEHGGNIWAESGAPGGTRMFVELPIEAPTAEMDRADAVPSKFTSHDLARILVIEDELAVLEVVQRALMRKGYLVEGTENGQEGLELLESQSYDLIICDIRMPGMNGIEFYHQLKKKKPDMLTKLIFTTGDTISPTSQSFLKLTNATVLPKPFELEKLIMVVREKLIKIDGR